MPNKPYMTFSTQNMKAMPTFYTLLHFWKYSPISNEEEFLDQELISTFYHHN